MTIITNGLWRARDAWLGPVVLIFIGALLLCGGEPWRLALRYDRAAIEAGDWWRLLSCNFVHLGFWHWLLNALSLVLLVLLCPEPVPMWAWILRVLSLCLGVGLGLYEFVPSLPTYVGLSGMIYGLFLLGLGRQALTGDGIAWACLVFLVVRVGWEYIAGAPASEEVLLGGRVVSESHICGMGTAVLYGIVAGAAKRWKDNARKVARPESPLP